MKSKRDGSISAERKGDTVGIISQRRNRIRTTMIGVQVVARDHYVGAAHTKEICQLRSEFPRKKIFDHKQGTSTQEPMSQQTHHIRGYR
jgi:hypothetical protein